MTNVADRAVERERVCELAIEASERKLLPRMGRRVVEGFAQVGLEAERETREDEVEPQELAARATVMMV